MDRLALCFVALLFTTILAGCGCDSQDVKDAIRPVVTEALSDVQKARAEVQKRLCANHLKQIGLALLNYESVYGCFPPAYIPDEKGQPKHSWRVLVLPFLDEDSLYREYNMNEPWDSARNRALASRIPEVYRCPSDDGQDTANTTYLMIVGKRAISDGPRSKALSDIQDGPSKTIMVVEVANSGVKWTEPRDMDAAAVGSGINRDMFAAAIRSRHVGGAYILLADGSERFLADNVEAATLEGASTVDGGEAVDFP